jgi:hypothetical protein
MTSMPQRAVATRSAMPPACPPWRRTFQTDPPPPDPLPRVGLLDRTASLCYRTRPAHCDAQGA